ncbi:MAG TPA: hypothetical protein VD902_05770 [Symbiobacteriaceae bacterium]|nr:hypothetical protein [Symbiobacteriaceae bacterium]
MKLIGRFGLAVTIGCWALALWSAIQGASPVRSLASGEIWWPGSLFSLLVAAVVLTGMQALPRTADFMLRGTGAGVPLWAVSGGLGLVFLIYTAWDIPTALIDGMAALELFAIGMGGLGLAGIVAPDWRAPARDGLPGLAGSPESLEGPPRTFTWTGRGTGFTPVEPYCVAAPIDEVRLEAQKVAPHDWILPRWQSYCTITPEIRHLAGEIRAISQREGLDRLDEVRLAMGLVAEGLGPVPVVDTPPAYPLETLSALAAPGATPRTILAVAILTALGYRAALLRTGERTALAVTGACPLPDLFLQVEGQPALYAEVTPEGLICGDAPAEARGLPWQVLPLRG